MTRALVEDSIGPPFGGQSTAHHSSDRRENRNTCFLTVVSGRVVGKAEVIGYFMFARDPTRIHAGERISLSGE
jgi:hypothetical protein